MMASFCELTIMAPNLKEFLGEFQRGVEVCVAGDESDTLLGIREAFRRFFRDGHGRSAPIAVVPQAIEERRGGLATSDEEAIELAGRAALALEERLPGVYHFYLAVEACVHDLRVGESPRFFVRSWAVLRGISGSSCGSSGSVEIPGRLLAGIESDRSSFTVPGTRKSGGILASLTGGLETRRSAVTEATLHALATQFYGVLEERG